MTSKAKKNTRERIQRLWHLATRKKKSFHLLEEKLNGDKNLKWAYKVFRRKVFDSHSRNIIQLKQTNRINTRPMKLTQRMCNRNFCERHANPASQIQEKNFFFLFFACFDWLLKIFWETRNRKKWWSILLEFSRSLSITILKKAFWHIEEPYFSSVKSVTYGRNLGQSVLSRKTWEMLRQKFNVLSASKLKALGYIS